MNRNFILIFSIVALSLVYGSNAQLVTATSNFCKVGTCAECEKSTVSVAGAKYCSSCWKSVKKLVEPATLNIYECVNKNSISDCLIYYADDNTTKAGCRDCDFGYVSTESGMLGSKLNFTCKKFDAPAATSIANCDKTIVVYGKVRAVPDGSGSGNYQSTPGTGSGLETALTICDKCKSGYARGGFTSDGSGNITVDACATLAAGTTKDNCEKHIIDGATTKCVSCASGYYLLAEVCTKGEGTPFLGCLNVTGGKCFRCDILRSYYAIDVDDVTGQKCAYNSLLVKIGILIFGLLVTF